MIELTEQKVQQFTKLLKSLEELSNSKVDALHTALTALVNESMNNLSTEQIKQKAEDNGMYCDEWVEFNSADENTWPDKPLNGDVIPYMVRVNIGTPFITDKLHAYDFYDWCYSEDDDEFFWTGSVSGYINVTHYTQLPEFKEK